ncbi:MAG: tol-pal system protein YbgF [candidate division Zixibacteria bacterium]|jgi:tol-pal system protein YbgF|nr:tol-pal system protein YbgF [candidate division Zixibacteria bacterium]
MPRTAVVLTAVLLVGLLFSSCATKRDVEEIKDQLTRIESQNRTNANIVERVDSLIATSTASNNALRSDVRLSMAELQQQISTLLENYNQLVNELNQMRRQLESRGVLRGSVGDATHTGPTNAAPGTPPPPPVTTLYNCDSTYDETFLLVRAEQYDRAIDGFRNFLAECGTHSNVSDAYFWIGECYYRQERYDRAVPEFEHLVATYPKSSKLVSAMYKIGRAKQELGRKDEARTLFQKIVSDYPESPEAPQAKDRLKEL